MTSHYEELTWPQIRAAARANRVLVLPVGTTEQHGHHLPLNVDIVCSTELARRAVERARSEALLMPSITYSFNEHHLDFPGTIAIQWDHIINYLVDIGRSVARHGFKKLLFVNGHGSNVPFLDIAARLITNGPFEKITGGFDQGPGIIAAMTSWWNFAEPAVSAIRESEFPGGMAHACELETSLMLHLRPELVDMKKAKKDINFAKSKHIFWDLRGGSPVTYQEFFSRYSKTGVVGDPTLASAAKGKKVAQCVVTGLTGFIQEFRCRKVARRVDHH